MQKTLVLNVVGMTRALLPHAPALAAFAKRGALPSEEDVGRIALGKAEPANGTRTLRAHVHFLTK